MYEGTKPVQPLTKPEFSNSIEFNDNKPVMYALFTPHFFIYETNIKANHWFP